MGQNCILYAGTYSDETEVGIHGYRLNQGEMALEEIITVKGVSNPSYLAVSADGGYLYSVLEDMTYYGSEGGGIAAFKREGNSLRLLNTNGTGGTSPCHILLDEKRGYLFAANYTGGSVSMFRKKKDGSIGELCDLKKHFGFGPDKERQEGPHVHYCGFASDGEGIWCVDLGLDRIKYYKIDEQNSRLVEIQDRDIRLPAGSGPRHFVLNPVRKEMMYVISELTSEIFVVDIGLMENRIVQRISILPDNASESTAAALHLSRDGRFLYASSRGEDSIAVFAVERKTGLLKLIEIVKVNGRLPRDFCLYGGRLFSANQGSDTITVFHVDEKSGKILFTGEEILCKSPVCLIVSGEQPVSELVQQGMSADEVEFSVFCIENVAARLNMTGEEAYQLMTKDQNILDEYVIPNFETLHTQSKEYIVNDIIDYMKECGWLK